MAPKMGVSMKRNMCGMYQYVRLCILGANEYEDRWFIPLDLDLLAVTP